MLYTYMDPLGQGSREPIKGDIGDILNWEAEELSTHLLNSPDPKHRSLNLGFSVYRV